MLAGFAVLGTLACVFGADLASWDVALNTLGRLPTEALL